MEKLPHALEIIYGKLEYAKLTSLGEEKSRKHTQTHTRTHTKKEKNWMLKDL